MSTQKLTAVVITAFLAFINTCHADQNTNITFTENMFYPESITWSAKQSRFFVSSVAQGSVGKVSVDGKFETFIKDDRLVSTFGVRVDDAHDRLWVVTGDIGASTHSSPSTLNKLSAVAVYDTKSAECLGYYDLTRLQNGPHFANDVAVDDDGNAYITESAAAVIYRISNSGSISIIAQSPLFKVTTGFGLNGIVYNTSGYLLVGKHATGEILKINISNPTKIERVNLPEPILGMDGMTLVDKKHLVVAVNLGTGRAVDLVSDDEWMSAKIIKTKQSVTGFPTSATTSGGNIWILNSRLDTLFDKKAAKVNEFIIQKF